MVRKNWCALACAVLLLLGLGSGCGAKTKKVRIGVSFGVGEAARWVQEKQFMEEYAQELDVDIEVRLNKTDEPKTQQQDCFEMIDSGIDVLIYTPRDVTKTAEVLAYAKEKKVPVINYARVLLTDKPDLYVGYDSSRIGQRMGQYLTEMVYEGDFILLRGDPGDYNSQLVYDGAMRYIDPLRDKINILLDDHVVGWSTDTAKAMVREALTKNGSHVDAILAPNDKIAGACAEVLAELNITDPVTIVGMDAELDAAKRIVAGTQSATIYMDLKVLAHTSIDEAVRMAKGEQPTINADFDNKGDTTISANLITGQLVTKENLDKVLIDGGFFTREQVYG